MNHLKFTVTGKDENGNPAEVVLLAKTPSGRVRSQGRMVHARAFGEATDAGVKIKQQIDKVLRQANLWDEERQAEFEKLRQALLDGELRLDQGDMLLDEARSLAIRMSKDRAALRALLSVRAEVEQHTADSIAEQAMFNHFVAALTVYSEGRFAGKPYFTKDGEHPSVDAYLDRSGDSDGREAAAKVGELLYGSDEAIVRDLPETRFLLDYGFVDDELNYVDGDGNKVDEQGRRIDEDGFLINEAGERVDVQGRRIDENGKYIVAFKPFVDKHGNPVAPRRK